MAEDKYYQCLSFIKLPFTLNNVRLSKCEKSLLMKQKILTLKSITE